MPVALLVFASAIVTYGLAFLTNTAPSTPRARRPRSAEIRAPLCCIVLCLVRYALCLKTWNKVYRRGILRGSKANLAPRGWAGSKWFTIAFTFGYVRYFPSNCRVDGARLGRSFGLRTSEKSEYRYPPLENSFGQL